jgi:RND superfamily putative drug exporter
VKQFGVGLSTGVALAALSVLVLAPAILTMAGRSAWWVPKWADRFLPHIDIEGASSEQGGKSAKPKPKKRAYDSMKL